MTVLNIVLLVLAFVCFAADAAGATWAGGRVKLTPLGLAAWMLNQLVILTPR